MSPQLENPKNLDFPPEVAQVLKVMFAGYQRVVIRKEFDNGLSGGRVIEVRPIKADGRPELPTVAKLAAISLIQKEWQAYQQHIRYRLPNIAEITAKPVLLPEIGWGGLRYTLMGGGGTFEVVSLYDYCRRPEVTVDDLRTVLERLFRVMHQMWRHNHTSPEFHLQSNYDRLLPVNLLIKHLPPSPNRQSRLIRPGALPLELLEPGTLVRLAGFAITKVDLVNQTVTLNPPKTTSSSAYCVRLKSQEVEQMATYPVDQIIELVEGEVIETRASRLRDELQRVLGQSFEPTSQMVSLPDGTNLPNPVAALPTLLNDTLDLKLADIHGDFNLGNILIEPETGTVSLIDFAEAREDHVLLDCLRLETEVMTKLIPEILHRHNLPLAPTLTSFYKQLHVVAFQAAPFRPKLPHPDLEKPFTMLTAIRQAVHRYLSDDCTEYYQALTIHLIGAMKFKNLTDVSKHVAFWGAAVAYQFFTALPPAPTKPSLFFVPIIEAYHQDDDQVINPRPSPEAPVDNKVGHIFRLTVIPVILILTICGSCITSSITWLVIENFSTEEVSISPTPLPPLISISTLEPPTPRPNSEPSPPISTLEPLAPEPSSEPPTPLPIMFTSEPPTLTSTPSRVESSPPPSPATPSPTVTGNEKGIQIEFIANNSIDSGGGPLTCEWDFGDGSSSVTSTNTPHGCTVPHVYPDNGTYTATLTITDNSGVSDTAFVYVTISNPNPGPNMSGDDKYVVVEVDNDDSRIEIRPIIEPVNNPTPTSTATSMPSPTLSPSATVPSLPPTPTPSVTSTPPLAEPPTSTAVSPTNTPETPADTPTPEPPPTNTPESPTPTPLTPTDIPVSPTNTPETPADTPTPEPPPTNTPETPTPTPLTPTDTPVSPTNTPETPTDTPTPEPPPTNTPESPTPTPLTPTDTPELSDTPTPSPSPSP